MEKSTWVQQTLVAYEGRLLRYAAKFVPEPAAREVVQEVFLRLWKQDPAELEGKTAEWLFHVCRNLSLDVLKKEGKLVQMDTSEEAGLADGQRSAGEALENAETDSDVQKLVALLPAVQAEVVRLKFQEGLSYKQISAITGHSVSHVGVLLHRAMLTLRAKLGASVSAKGGSHAG
ncbi:MAG: sigma-70 family RNA polymerase sigma factor [Deltaproteobacteria bacterium]|nr:sigma-70 family RNA polymerase sigma factor [Deltaproteobacteria bacterium]